MPHGLDHTVLDHEDHSCNNDGGKCRFGNIIEAGGEVEQGNDDDHTGVQIGQLSPYATGIKDSASGHASVAAQTLDEGVGHIAHPRGDKFLSGIRGLAVSCRGKQ